MITAGTRLPTLIRFHTEGLEAAVRRWIDEIPAGDLAARRARLQLHRELTALKARVETLLVGAPDDLPEGPKSANIPRP